MRQRLPTFCLLACFAVLAACAHSRTGQSASGLKTAGDTFLQRIRWRDFRGAGELILPERRAKFDRLVAQFRDENDLTITDYQIEDVRLGADEAPGQVIARLRWLKMPSVTERTAIVTSEFVFRGGTWFLARQDEGPFAEALDEPLPRPTPP